MRIKDTPNALWIKNARLGFPALIAPKAVQGGAAKYNCNFILNPQAAEYGEMWEIVCEMAKEKWGDNATNILNMITADKRLRCYGGGHEKINAKNGAIYEGFEGMVYISAANTDKPVLYGQDAQELPPTANANQLFVGGNIVAGVVSFWLQDNEHGRAVRANLDGVQYVGEGEHFGSSGPDTSGIFQAVAGAPAPTAAAPGAPVVPGAVPPGAPVAPKVDPLS